MYYFVVLVLDDVNQGPEVIDAWDAAGVGGITIIESTGLARLRKMQGHRDDIPLMPSIRALFQTREEHHRTIFSIVEGEEMVNRLITATEAIVGELDEPNTGILFALPISHVAGVPRRSPEQST
jgi:hypothetical protein